MNLKLEAIVIPASDVDRAKKFYEIEQWVMEVRTQADGPFQINLWIPDPRLLTVLAG
jgi:hypothetical protein